MTATDTIRSHGLSVDLHSCPECDNHRKMEELHRIHVERLYQDAAHGCELESELAADISALKSEIKIWKLVSFAGWFVVALSVIRDLMQRWM